MTPVHLKLRLLTRDHEERGGRLDLVYWATGPEGPVRLVFTDVEPVFFVERGVQTRHHRRRELKLTTPAGAPVDGVYFQTRRQLLDERERLRSEGYWPFEADLRPEDRFLMERFITAGVEVRGEGVEEGGVVELRNPAISACEVDFVPSLLSFDLESDGLEGALLSIACAGVGGEHVWIVSEQAAPAGALCVPDQETALRAFFEHVAEADPDILIGWNVIDFDLSFLQRRCQELGVDFVLGRGGRRARVIPAREQDRGGLARIPGRVVMDGISTMRAATWTFERYGLEYVAQELLGRGKAIDQSALVASVGTSPRSSRARAEPGSERDLNPKVAEINRLHREDLPALARYNLEDARLVLEIFDVARLLHFALERQRLTGLPFDRRAGAVSSFDHLYLPRLHRKGFVAPDAGSSALTPQSPGGFVMDSQPGLYENVLVLDFKSLYPSLIRTFLIDPLGLWVAGDDAVPGFEGGRFHREQHILPGLVETLWAARDAAKRDRNAALSGAIKILMNSFYGVLGTPLCRFFDPRLASSITLRGHEVLQESRKFIESRGWPVIYGDTDSVFVLLGTRVAESECAAFGAELTRDLNTYWTARIADDLGLESKLELEFETHFARFLMPTMRHSAEGSKKRYAGLIRQPGEEPKLVFKGLEAVRTDWTPLARDFQRELVRRIFVGAPFEDWVRQTCDDLLAGALDDQLVYRKRLRRPVDEYTKTCPPHVAAARLLGTPTRYIEYVITTRGPEPVGYSDAKPDYDHYLERQLAPAAEVILPFVGVNFGTLGARQRTLW